MSLHVAIATYISTGAYDSNTVNEDALLSKLLEELGILTELTGQKKNRTFSYAAYIQLLSE
jgi:hypothetical protein